MIRLIFEQVPCCDCDSQQSGGEVGPLPGITAIACGPSADARKEWGCAAVVLSFPRGCRDAALPCAVLSEVKELDRAETLHFVQGDRTERSSRVFASVFSGFSARQTRAGMTDKNLRCSSAHFVSLGLGWYESKC
jgi:hypothetical protein